MAIDIVSFGETMLRFGVINGMRLEDASMFHVYVGGSESNTLACLARLGLHATWISALPLSPLGKHVETELRRHGVDTHILWADANVRLGIFYSEEAPDPLGLHVYYDRASSACALIDPERVDLTLVDEARMLHLTGITPALSENARWVYERLLARARDTHTPLAFDVNYRAKLWSPQAAAATIEQACQQAEVLLCTRNDASELWGFTGGPEAMLWQMSQRFARHGDHKTLILTLGSEGAAQMRDGQFSDEPAFPTQGNSRFGSGDAFAAGYLYAYLEGSLYQALRDTHGVTPLAFGNALAALKRCIPGDIACVTPDEVQAILQRTEGSRFR